MAQKPRSSGTRSMTYFSSIDRFTSMSSCVWFISARTPAILSAQCAASLASTAASSIACAARRCSSSAAWRRCISASSSSRVSIRGSLGVGVSSVTVGSAQQHAMKHAASSSAIKVHEILGWVLIFLYFFFIFFYYFFLFLFLFFFLVLNDLILFLETQWPFRKK